MTFPPPARAAGRLQRTRAPQAPPSGRSPPPPSRTTGTRLVHPSVLIGHVSSPPPATPFPRARARPPLFLALLLSLSTTLHSPSRARARLAAGPSRRGGLKFEIATFHGHFISKRMYLCLGKSHKRSPRGRTRRARRRWRASSRTRGRSRKSRCCTLTPLPRPSACNPRSRACGVSD
jgi:hypothetical protein